VRRWAAGDATELAEYDVELLLERSDAVHPNVAEVWQPFTATFASVVADPASVPAIRPLRMVTAEPVTDRDAIRAALAAELHEARQPPTRGQ
jgi:hypothetical protein